MPNISKKAKEKQLNSFEDHAFLTHITKTLYYGRLPKHERLSLPVTELASELFSEAQNGRSLDRLHCNDAASISRNSCVSPCAFILAMLYLERLKACNPEYVLQISPSDLFLVSLMVSSKFLYDDGQDGEVFLREWAESGGISPQELSSLEREFLNAIDWNIFVNEMTFCKKLAEVERILATREGKQRGWYTYTEINTLMNVDVHLLYQYVTYLTVMLVSTYLAGLLTIVASMYIISHIPTNTLQPIEDTTAACNDTTILHHIPDVKFTTSFTEESFSSYNRKSIDAVDVLKASMILASITAPEKEDILDTAFYNNTCDNDLVDGLKIENKEFISWDWWTSPAMTWLSETSQTILNYACIPLVVKYTRFMDAAIANLRIITLQDQVHKGTKVRIQDQLERSWHKEWTDMIRSHLFDRKFLKNVKLPVF